MKLKNYELSPAAQGLLELRKERLAVKTSFAIAKSVNKLIIAAKDFDDAREAILTSSCIKGEDGKPVPKMEKSIGEDGKEVEIPAYQFETPELKTQAMSKIDELSKTEVEVELVEILEADILAESNLTPEHVQSLLILVK